MAASLARKPAALSFFLARNARPKIFETRHCTPKVFTRMAGHSHWQNIKFKKAHKDFQRSKVFGKLAMEIIATVRGEAQTVNVLSPQK